MHILGAQCAMSFAHDMMRSETSSLCLDKVTSYTEIIRVLDLQACLTACLMHG